MLTCEFDGDLARLTLVRGEKLNALTAGFWDELERTIDVLEESDVCCAILSGEGKAFCVGGDVNALAALQTTAERHAYVLRSFELYERLAGLSVPTIAAVHGFALGGGFELALSCDITVADESAQLGTPEGRIGIVPGVMCGVGSTLGLRPSWFNFMVLSGERIAASRALELGIVESVVEVGGHVRRAEELAGSICASAPQAVRAAKRLLVSGRPRADLDALATAVVALIEDEGRAARTARFSDSGNKD